MESMHLEIDGMSCGHCVGAVKTALAELPGVRVQDVRVGSADVSYDPSTSSPEQIAEAVREAGYETQGAGGVATDTARPGRSGGCGCG